MCDGQHSEPPDRRLRISNEFASVVVALEDTGAGTRLSVAPERLGRTIRLDAVGLEALCRLTPEAMSAVVSSVQEDPASIRDFIITQESEEVGR